MKKNIIIKNENFSCDTAICAAMGKEKFFETFKGLVTKGGLATAWAEIEAEAPALVKQAKAEAAETKKKP